MFRKRLNSLTKPKEATTPRQGKRLIKEESASGDLTFIIKGTGRPGFFVLFGSFFCIPPTFIGLAMLFGTTTSDSDSISSIFAALFLLPFFSVGGGALLTGLFLWLGKSTIHLSQEVVSVQRQLFGKVFKQKEFSRNDLDLSFEKSHETNDVASYKLTLKDGRPKNKIGIGGSLKEEELLWLERELRTALGQETEAHANVMEAISKVGIDEIYDTVIDPNYRSKTLRFTKTNNGWDAQSRPSLSGSIVMILTGSFFVIVALMMITGSREFILDLVPGLRTLIASFSSSSGNPPLLFALAFGGTGSLVFLGGVFLLGYRLQISKRHSRLHVERRWTILTMASVNDASDFTRLEVKQTGHANDVPRYRFTAHLKNAKKVTLLGFAPAEDAGQLHAHIKEMMPNLSE